MKTITVHHEFEDAELWAKFVLAYGVDSAECPTDRGNLSWTSIVDVRVTDVVEVFDIDTDGDRWPIDLVDCQGRMNRKVNRLVQAELDVFVLKVAEQLEKDAAFAA